MRLSRTKGCRSVANPKQTTFGTDFVNREATSQSRLARRRPVGGGRILPLQVVGDSGFGYSCLQPLCEAQWSSGYAPRPLIGFSRHVVVCSRLRVA